jgi:hypothetical protein
MIDFFVLTGDVNRDRSVNGTDFAILAGNFGRTGRTYQQGDLNGDGSVNGTDFAMLAGNFGKSVPAPAVVPAPAAAAVVRAAPAAPGLAAVPRRTPPVPVRRTAPPRHPPAARVGIRPAGKRA